MACVLIYSFKTNRYVLVVEGLRDITVWMPDSRRLLYTQGGKVFVADTATKKVREVYARPHEFIRSANVSRDGRLLYYTVLESESDIWMLEPGMSVHPHPATAVRRHGGGNGCELPVSPAPGL